MRSILQRDNQKRNKKIQHKPIFHCSLKQNCEKSRRDVNAKGKIEYIYLIDVYIYIESTKHELRFCAGSNPARGLSQIAMARISD